MRSDTYQILLILSGLLVSALLGAFLYREIFPEYKIYQNDYLALEAFRSTYTHEPVPPFEKGIKQIVLEREDKGPPTIDRCMTCHVALQIPYFSPTKIARDLNGNILRDEKGNPFLIANEGFIWNQLDEKIANLRDSKILEHLESQGETKLVKQRLKEAEQYEALKTTQVGDRTYDVKKVLKMHPLMGNETYPFEYHPIEQYGCTSCHSGNGRGLVSDKAHGPVFDGQYDIENLGPNLHFTESDSKNDLLFSKVFNHKPGEDLIFQTDPLFVGPLIQAKCVQCHKTSALTISEAKDSLSNLSSRTLKRLQELRQAYKNEKESALDLLELSQEIEKLGYRQTLEQLQKKQSDFLLPSLKLEHLASQEKYLKEIAKNVSQERENEEALAKIYQDLKVLLGSNSLVDGLKSFYQAKRDQAIDLYIEEQISNPMAKGLLFMKAKRLDRSVDSLFSLEEESEEGLPRKSFISDIDNLTLNYERGKELFLSQACYACHRIAAFSRGGIGPDLTQAGESYPWYLKRKLMWPQGDLATSTMPNMRFDSQELQDLMTFLLAQRGNPQSISKTNYQAGIQAWEAGKKVPWERPISPSEIYDLQNSMTIFATQGCAACHRLQGFESTVGFKVEKETSNFDHLYQEQKWFKKLFPEVVHFTHYDEELPGSEIVSIIDQHAKEIDERIVEGVREKGLLEEIDLCYPEVIESFYSPFRYAARAKNHHYQTLIEKEKDSKKIAEYQKEWNAWKERVHRILMMYIQTYGLGRLIGPHLNWSGIYRTDEWLMEHFKNPTSHIPRSIMPVFPFDDTKFYALTYMLDVLALKNREAVRQIWEKKGFDPKEAYDMLCAQCHGIDMVGNGAIAEWIYPITKNLHNPNFLRHLTKDKVLYSIVHGVRGTPMPPWGEGATDKPKAIQNLSHIVPVLKEEEARYLVDWLFSHLSGEQVIRQSIDVPKWQYRPEDVLKELESEGNILESKEPSAELIEKEKIEEYYAALIPKIYVREPAKNSYEVEDIFDVSSTAIDTEEKSYYIKKKFYTPYNIEEGQKFFLLNCAVCHGSEADGSGSRSQVMREAKPRMLTNADWIDSHDDLRLLRSIKYGVQGTSMTPWGDLTNSLQRLQLVIFIRSLTKQQHLRRLLFQSLYQAFEQAQVMIDQARIEGNEQIKQLKRKAEEIEIQQKEIEHHIKQGKEEAKKALPFYVQTLEIEKEIKSLEKRDTDFFQLKQMLKKERELYNQVGVAFISKDFPENILRKYFDLVSLNSDRYLLQSHQLVILQDDQKIEQIRKTRQEIVQWLDKSIKELEKDKERESFAIYQKMRAKLMTDTEDALRLAREQREMVSNLSQILR